MNRQRRWEERNKEKVSEYHHDYYMRNKEERLAKSKEWRKKNPMSSEESSKRQAKWRAKNPDRVKELVQQGVTDLKDWYVAQILKRNITEVTPEMIELKRQQISMKRTLKQFKKWREENESDNTDVQTKQYKDEEDYGREVQTG